jgi:precorrin isomerase
MEKGRVCVDLFLFLTGLFWGGYEKSRRKASDACKIESITVIGQLPTALYALLVMAAGANLFAD